MKISRGRTLAAVVIVLALYYAWTIRKEKYENEKAIRDRAKAKNMTQEELDAIIKYIK